MTKTALIFLALSFCGIARAQLSRDSIRQEDIERILNVLTSDSLKGRGNGTPEIHKAALFIRNEFSSAGLQTFPNFPNYFQFFKPDPSLKLSNELGPAYDSSRSMLNVVGVLEGTSGRGEAVIFSAHYDHVGSQNGEIFNGANDNASGTAALLALAAYYASRGANERTLIFCAFAGEELGLLGSQAFLPHVQSDSIVAVINIEMIGRSSVGRSAFFITGFHLSDVPKIIRNNLKGKAKVKREPDLAQQLFTRSDNYPFALKGIPAHTIMCSDDTDPCYHQPCDDLKNLNLPNMTNVVRLIAVGSESLINGKDRSRRISVSRAK